MDNDEHLKYPIGKQEQQQYADKAFNPQLKQQLLLEIKMLPNTLEIVIQNLDESQLQTPYRKGGWTVNQLVHHLADSHINAYCRFKYGLTENEPVIKTYDQDDWAKLPDNALPVNISVTLLHALHARWFSLLNAIIDKDWSRTIFHPELKKNISLWELLKMYAWHGKHHVAQIMHLKEKNNWDI